MNEQELMRDLQAVWHQGFAAAMDPRNQVTFQQDSTATTTSSSPWVHRRCIACAHTFRSGDEVKIVNGQVQHQNSSAFCESGQDNRSKQEESSTEPSLEARAFFDGVDAAWPPPEHAIRLEAGHRLLAPPFAGFRRHSCLMCGHTFRPYDQVVICPCSPEAPLCGAAIHRDPIRGLNCLQSWNPGGISAGYCPVTSRQLANL